MSREADPEGFLARWSRRKRAIAETPPEAEAGPPDAAPPADALPAGAPAADSPPEAAPAAEAAPAPAGCPIPQVPEIDPASLPRIEDLTVASDLGPFLRPGVPAALRHAALRRMWSLDASIRDYIGPVEYQWDFNTPGGLPAGFANTLVGDVGKLLAQAIGQVEEAAAREAAPALPAPSAPVAPPGVAPPEGQIPLAEAPEPPMEAEVPLPRREDGEAKAPRPHRRRHGSALPV